MRLSLSTLAWALFTATAWAAPLGPNVKVSDDGKKCVCANFNSVFYEKYVDCNDTDAKAMHYQAMLMDTSFLHPGLSRSGSTGGDCKGI
ncbi:hypothetical protein CERZMDRAFT_102430 [Cercospora zeae-maydis SCOH1-5]|uniref:Uncharacterized protein n=1 Tax=Cercospora zeae-maydis SCOH1-5 TaxID=717836 RepID=A0A6A6F209_9PEZI|nr:hypothetical protein CERZMDRAFT_102430 [Cercospora zeae-maydis SCOH1-5]